MRHTVHGICVLAVVAAVSACAGDGPAPEPGTGAPTATEPPAIRVGLEPVVEGLDVPNDLADLGDGRILVSDQVGLVHLLTGDGLADEPVLDLTDRVYPPSTAGGTELELGLSGIAVHPDFADNGRLYVFSTEPPPDDAEGQVGRVDVLSEFTLGGEPLVADRSSERVLLRAERPSTLHVGGHLVFGADGLLYAGLGDAGVDRSSQDTSVLSGSIIRIDVDGGDPYRIPADNPFVDGGGAPEIFAHGLRNPMRVSWLDGVGLLVADPKFRSKHQDVYVAVAGADYGWPDLPGRLPDGSCYASPQERMPLPECGSGPDGAPIEPPVVEYGPRVGQIVSGVVPYRGEGVPALAGNVLVSDWHGAMLAASPGPTGQQWQTRPVEARLPGGELFTAYLWALDSDASGEVYALTASRTFADGRGVIYRIVTSD